MIIFNLNRLTFWLMGSVVNSSVNVIRQLQFIPGWLHPLPFLSMRSFGDQLKVVAVVLMLDSQ